MAEAVRNDTPEQAEFRAHCRAWLEAHHPEYLDIDQLRELFTAPKNRQADTSSHIQQLVLAQHHD